VALDFNHGTLKQRSAVPTAEMLDGAAAVLEAREPRRNYLGASRLGDACARKLQYEFLGVPQERQLDAKTHLVFSAGHSAEAAVALLLKGAGFDLRTHKASGAQFGFSVANERIRGHIDGVICDGPTAFGPYPYLWENKAVANKYWQAIVKKGVAVERPVYAGQVATYQAYMDLTEHPALFSIVNRDTGEIAFERLPFDAKLAQACSDRGVAVLQACDAGETLPRAYARSDFFECRFCPFHDRCWEGA
jgi:hypothetical protein